MSTGTVDALTLLGPDLLRLGLDGYHRMVAAGVFDEDRRVELLEGLIVEMAPQKPPHAVVTARLSDALFTGLPPTHRVRCQLPLSLGDSEPEPDIAVLRRLPRDSKESHPDQADLVVEVAEASLRKDREVKGRIYARAGIPEYVIADLARFRLLVLRDPDRGTGDYRTFVTLERGQRFEAASVPGFGFDLDALFADLD